MIEVFNTEIFPRYLNNGDLLVHDDKLWIVDEVSYSRSTQMTTVKISNANDRAEVDYPEWAEAKVTRARVFEPRF